MAEVTDKLENLDVKDGKGAKKANAKAGKPKKEKVQHQAGVSRNGLPLKA